MYSEILFACETVQHLNMPRKTACSEQQQQQVKFFSSNVTLLGRNRAGPAPATSGPMGYVSLDQFEMAPVVVPRGRRGASRHGFASASVALQESVRAAPSAPVSPKVDLKPASDVLAGAMARAASQSTIHPLDTLKVPWINHCGAAWLWSCYVASILAILKVVRTCGQGMLRQCTHREYCRECSYISIVRG